MNKKYLFSTALCALLTITSACSNDEPAEEQTNGKQITMTASNFKYADGSRTSIDITSGGGEFNWAENDTVGIFPNEGAQAYFPMINGAGTKTASFNGGGWALKPSSTYAAYYPYNFYNRDVKTISVNLEGQNQSGNASTAHLGKYDYMSAVANTPSNGNVNFEFQHLCALVELNITVPNKGDLRSVTLSSDEAIFTTKGTIDLTSATPMVKSESISKSINLDLRGVTTTTDKETTRVYLMMAPVNLTGKTITASIINNGVEHKGVVESKNLEAGKLYSLTVSLEGQKPIQNTYHVEKAGTLPQLIGDENKFKITELKLSGELNGTDIRFIREMAGRDVDGNATNGLLANLNLYDTKIIEGGDYYYQNKHLKDTTYFTKNDIIHDATFYECSSLMRIILPNSVTTIGEDAFDGCSGLTSITIPNSVNTIGDYAFYGCSSLTSITIPNLVNTIGYHVFACCSGLTSITIPNSVTTIGEDAFFRCSGLTSITIPNSVTIIDNYAFEDCSGLTSITIPNSVTKIGDYAFSSCSGLTSITIPNSVNTISAGTFNGCRSLTSITIPNSVTKIGNHAFSGCSGLTSINIPNSVNTIGYYAFEDCSGLTSITIPNSVTTIGEDAFLYCNKLETIIIRNGMKILEANLLSSATSCKKVYLPSTLKQIRSQAFPPYAKNVYCFALEAPILYTNSGISETCKIYVPKTSVEKYKASDGWKEYAANIFEMPEGVIEP